MDSTSRAVPHGASHLPAERPPTQPAARPSGMRWVPVADAASAPPPPGPAGLDSAVVLLRPWGSGSAPDRWTSAAPGSVPAVPVPRGIPVP
ncbi:hypothetical protein [Streptomyces anandii]|uniref:hypothetical protein n=1 Tax=Streptomyces anandii TaxID=285454 RepID=UPI0019CF262B|nr:hypothetical protein [Streptomyces anandii]GGX96461.1 hypothetical protein GCM10010510_47320 [Streptomyces anandii JCM 4720]